MSEDHSKWKDATVPHGDMRIPLIGIPKDSSIEECDLCSNFYALWEIEYNGIQFLCCKCKFNERDASI